MAKTHPTILYIEGFYIISEDSGVLLNPELLRGWLFEIKERFFGNSKAIVFLGEMRIFGFIGRVSSTQLIRIRYKIISVIPFLE